MNKFLLFLLISNLLVLSQTNAQYKIIEGTFSNRETGTYHKMLNYDTSPYEDYYLTDNNNSFKMNFRLLKPNGYDQTNTQKKYPMVVMLHGKGEAGYSGGPSSISYRNNDYHLLWGGIEHLAAVNSKAFPGFVVFPQQDQQDGEWRGGDRNNVVYIIETLINQYNIDPTRVYVHGLSAGSTSGVWAIIDLRPDLFAAALPMAGVPPNANTYPYQRMVHIPIWQFQGEIDNQHNSNPQKVANTLNNLRAIGGTPRFKEYPQAGHSIWNDAYKEPDFFSWMLGYSKLSIHVYYGKNEFCPEDDVNARLGISPGPGYNYEWSKDDVVIPNSNSNEITATEYGYYRVRFEHPVRGWTAWSDSVVIGIRDKTRAVNIIANGTTVFPSPDHKESVTLSAPEGYESYLWSSGETTRSITVNKNNADTYRVKVTEPGGCESDYSLPIVVVNDGESLPAPSDLIANVVSEAQVNLFWKDNTDNETGFEVFRSTSSGEPYEFIAKTGPDAVFYADKTVSPNTTYYYVIRAINNTGASPISQEVIAVTPDDLKAPSIPQNLYGTGNLDLASITLYWDASEDNVGVAGYDIYRVNGDNSLTYIGTTDKTTYVVSGLVENTQHTFVVRAKDLTGNLSPSSSQTTVTVQFCGVNFKLYKNSPWNSVDELREVEVHYRGHSDNFDINIIDQYFPDDLNYFGFVFEGYIWINNPGNYTFTTNSDDGSKLWINDQQVVDNDGRHGRQDREGSVNLSAGRHKIKVAFFQANQGYGLDVSYRGPDTGGSKTIIAGDALCSTNSAPSPSGLEAPVDLQATTVSGSEIYLTWTDNNAGEASYEVYRRKEDGQYILVQTLSPGTETFEDTDLEASTTYYYKLRAISPTGESSFTDDGRLTYAYYEGTGWNAIPNFNALSPIKTGEAVNFDLSLRNRDNNFAFVFTGNLTITTAGDYTFYLNSDDGSKLYVDDLSQPLVDFDGAHGVVGGDTEGEDGHIQGQPNKTIYLSSGIHPIKVEFFEAGGNEYLWVRYNGPDTGGSPILIRDEALNTGIVKATTLGDATPPTAPSELAILSVGPATVGLSWLPSMDNVEVVGYEIYDEAQDTLLARTDANGIIITDDGETVNSLAVPAAKGFKKAATNAKHSILSETEEPPLKISTLVEGLTPTTGYYIYVKAIDASNNKSEKSNTVEFTTGSEQPLPIELLDFYAEAKNGFIEIKWITASEKNNDFFTLERSLDGKEFRPIGEVDGMGNSVETTYYTYEDHNPSLGVQYYQLKQTDFDGAYEYSKIIRVSYQEHMSQFEVTVFPNPVSTSYDFAVQINSSNKESSVSISIFDMLGREHYRAIVEAESALNEIKISKASLSAGIYIVSVQQADKITKKRIIVE